MANQPLQYEIREIPDPEGGIVLELWVEGSRLGRAAASADILRTCGRSSTWIRTLSQQSSAPRCSNT